MLYLLAIISYVLATFVSWYAFTVNARKNVVSLYDHKTLIVGILAVVTIVLFRIASGSIWLAILYLVLTGIGIMAVTYIVILVYLKTHGVHLGYREP